MAAPAHGYSNHTADFGLMFYNARWYDPTLGRFAQADTIVPGGAQGLDRYAYVNNSPMNYVDPSGHTTMCGATCEEEYEKPKNKSNNKPSPADKRVMSLLGFDSSEISKYQAWAIGHADLYNVLLAATAGDVIKFTYTSDNGNQGNFDLMVMEYQDGYTFYDPKNRSRYTGFDESSNYAFTFGDFVSGAGVYNETSDGVFERGATTPGYSGPSVLTLSENWDQPVGTAIITRSPANAYMSLAAWGSSIIAVASAPSFLTIPSIVTAGWTFYALDTVPRYKDHPHGP